VNLGSHLVQRLLRLDPPQTRDLIVERDLRCRCHDGTHPWAVILPVRQA
jgi:uncharacterized protein